MFKTKILSKKDFDALSAKANNFDNIVSAIVANNPGLKPEDVTMETIEELMQNDSSDETDPELQLRFETLQTDYNTVVQERDGLQEQVTNLLNAAGEDPAVITSTGEASGKTETLLDFANKNKGDTAAIIMAAQEDGFLPK